MSTKTCPQCHAVVPADEQFCQECGFALTAQAPQKERTPARTVLLDPDFPVPPPAALEWLPPDAILQDRYLVQKSWGAREEGLQRYLVEDIAGIPACPSCHTEVQETEQFCSACGQPLKERTRLWLSAILKESAQSERLATESHLATLRSGFGLQLPGAAFSQKVGGAMRYYIVQTQRGVSLDELKGPQEVTRVLQWGAQLARGLEQLHSMGIAFRALTPGNIWCQEETARLAEFGNAQHTTDAALFRTNLTELITLLVRKMGGQEAIPAPLQPQFQGWLQGRAPENGGALARALEQMQQTVRRPLSHLLQSGKRSDVGMQRELNEDSMLVLEIISTQRSLCLTTGLYVVADGMGGHEGGEIASGMTIQTLRNKALAELFAPERKSSREWLQEGIAAANLAVFEEARRRRTDMGTTVVAALVEEGRMTIAHAGDSRAWLVTERGMVPLTKDHSLVERLVATGQITAAEARNHPQGNIVYRTLGDKPKVEADVLERTLQPGEWLLLCSDGLHGMLETGEMHRIVTGAADPQAACDALVQAANEAGGEDNITAILVCHSQAL